MKRTIVLALLILLITGGISSCQPKKQPQLIKLNGEAQGTYYAITYFDQQNRNLQVEIDSLLKRFDSSASVYKPNSIISRINNNDTSVRTDRIFNTVFQKSMEISANTAGAFDITVGPLVNAWGFGFTSRIKVDRHVIDSLLPLVNYKAVHLRGNKVYKDNPGIKLDYNAIAQGFSTDEIGRFLQSNGIQNFLVDVGGEVLGHGKKPDSSLWNVGVEKPSATADDSRTLKAVILLKDMALSTSGNYRKYFEENGVRYSHTIDPKTGAPVKHSLLSVSVLATDCISADAYATAFMVMGLEQAKIFLQNHPELQAYFIYSSSQGELLTFATQGFKKIIKEQY